MLYGMNEIHPIYLILIFIPGYIGACCLVSILSGWFWLSKNFPASKSTDPVLHSYSWKSINLNYVAAYRGCINMEITEGGLILKMSFMFSTLHRPIFLPWASMKDFIYKKALFQKAIFKVGKIRLVVFGRVAKSLAEYFTHLN
jgi:hypothetical protein